MLSNVDIYSSVAVYVQIENQVQFAIASGNSNPEIACHRCVNCPKESMLTPTLSPRRTATSRLWIGVHASGNGRIHQ